MNKNTRIRLAAYAVAAVAVFSASAVEFSKAGYWEAEGSPRRIETLTTGWEFSLDGFKTSKRVALPHSIDEGEIGFEASGCVNRQQPAWYRRKFDWKRHGAHFEGSEYAGEMRDRLKIVSLDFNPSDEYPAWATKRVYEAMVKIPSDAWKCRLDLGAVRDWATVFVDGRKVADLWCNPYSCDLTRHITQGGSAAIRVEVVSTWYNALVHDAALPEREQKTWTINGPDKSAKYHPAGLLGPAKIDVFTRSSACVRSSY